MAPAAITRSTETPPPTLNTPPPTPPLCPELPPVLRQIQHHYHFPSRCLLLNPCRSKVDRKAGATRDPKRADCLSPSESLEAPLHSGCSSGELVSRRFRSGTFSQRTLLSRVAIGKTSTCRRWLCSAEPVLLRDDSPPGLRPSCRCRPGGSPPLRRAPAFG